MSCFFLSLLFFLGGGGGCGGCAGDGNSQTIVRFVIPIPQEKQQAVTRVFLGPVLSHQVFVPITRTQGLLRDPEIARLGNFFLPPLCSRVSELLHDCWGHGKIARLTSPFLLFLAQFALLGPFLDRQLRSLFSMIFTPQTSNGD